MKSRLPYFLTAILAITYLAACDSGPDNTDPQLFVVADSSFTEVDMDFDSRISNLAKLMGRW